MSFNSPEYLNKGMFFQEIRDHNELLATWNDEVFIRQNGKRSYRFPPLIWDSFVFFACDIIAISGLCGLE